MRRQTLTPPILIASIWIALQGAALAADFTTSSPSWGPWNNHPPVQRDSSLAGHLFRFYQSFFSSEDGAACPFYPTCSAYAYQALKKHGWAYGSLLAIDRLFSEYPGMPKSGLYPLITKYGMHRPYDPVP